MASQPFVFPQIYSFPAFFTLQPNLTSRHAQLEHWSALILSYTRHHRIFRLSALLDPSHAAFPLFHNASINRHLSTAAIRTVLEFMSTHHHAEPTSRKPDDATEFYMYWRTPGQWADALAGWIDESAQHGVVFTLFELIEGDDSAGRDFHGMDPDVLKKALDVLVKKGRAEVFGTEELGVKFLKKT